MNQAIAMSEGGAQVEFQLLLPESPPLLLKSGTVAHSSSLICEALGRRAKYSHCFRCQGTDFVDKFLRTAMTSVKPRLRFRLGIGMPVSARWGTWIDHPITDYSCTLEGGGENTGHFLELRTSDDIFRFGIATKTVARRGLVSDMVQQIASEHDIQSTVIEATEGRFLLIQSFQSDEDFIRLRLTPRAINNKGRGNYHLYFRDNVLHFHSPDYQANVQELHYYQTPSVMLAEHDQSQLLFDLGASGVRMVHYSPYTGLAREISSDPQKSLRYANLLYPISTIPNGQRIMFYSEAANAQEEAVALAQNAYESARGTIFKLNLEIDKTIIGLGDLLRLVISPTARRASVWSGLWMVSAISHSIVKGALRTQYILERGEINSVLGGQVCVSDAEGKMSSEAMAPGQDPNLPEAASSVLTKGAGESQAGLPFSDVRDPKVP